MTININCVFIKDHVDCTNQEVKRSLFGLGPRLCTEYGNLTGKKCVHCVEHKRPKCPPSPQMRKAG